MLGLCTFLFIFWSVLNRNRNDQQGTGERTERDTASVSCAPIVHVYTQPSHEQTLNWIADHVHLPPAPAMASKVEDFYDLVYRLLEEGRPPDAAAAPSSEPRRRSPTPAWARAVRVSDPAAATRLALAPPPLLS